MCAINSYGKKLPTTPRSGHSVFSGFGGTAMAHRCSQVQSYDGEERKPVSLCPGKNCAEAQIDWILD